jgi:PAS domain S-box-containing protein
MEASEKKFDEFEELVLELDMARILFAEEEEEEEARIVVSIKDITERKRAEEALRESEERYRQLFEAESDAIVLIDNATGCILEANSAAAALYGYSKEELLSKKNSDLSAEPEETQRVTQTTPVDVNRVVTVPLRFHRKQDGSVFPVEITGRFLIRQGRSVHIAAIRDITERKRAEEALSMAEENFRRSLDESPLGVRIVSTNGETLYANRAILGIYGYDSIEELRTTPVKKRYTPESYAEFQIRKKKRQQGEYDPPEYEISIVRKNGEVRHLQVFRKEVLWNGEKQYQAIYLDITERKWAEEALQESKELFEKTFVSQRDAIFLLDAINPPTILDCNPAATEVFGYTREEMVGRTTDFLHVDETAQKEFQGQLSPTIAERGFMHLFEFRMRRKDGKVFPTEHSVIPLEDEQGKRIGWVSVVRDITEAKRTKEELIEREMFNFALFEYNPIQTVVVDLEGKVTGFNLAKKKSGDRLPNIGDVMYRDYAGGHGSEMYGELMACIRSGEIKEFPEQKYGEKVLSITISPFAKGAVIISQDITERKRAEKEQISSHEQLRALAARLQFVREEERTQIAREIHDELGQELAGLKMDLSWLKKKLPKREKLLVEKTQSMLKFADTTIQSVRKISTKLRPGVLDDLGLLAAIEWQTQDFRDRTGIKCELNSSVEDVELDRDRSTEVFRIFQETLTNVVRHAKATRIIVNVDEDAGNLILRVKDNGRGITESEISNLKSLGLLGMRERALLFGGEVKISGIPGEGTIVTVTIPLKQGEK